VAETQVFDNKTRRKLEQVMLWSSRIRAGAMKGERRSNKRGTSIEFADYRNYTRGDDLRRLDWNVYARLQKPYIKLLEDEEDLAVHILLDASASMNWPQDTETPDENKFTYAQRLAAGIAYASLTSNDRLTLTAANSHGLQQFGPARGRARGVPLLQFVDGLTSDSVTDWNSTLRDYALRARQPGLCFIISDMFSPSGYLEGFKALLGKGYEVVILHILSPDEVNPPLTGDLRLVDVETGQGQEISLDPGMHQLYTARLAEWQHEIQTETRKRGAHYLSIETDTPWEKVILQDLRRMGLLR
jgi:uncharacterized protein (DUF58 family)